MDFILNELSISEVNSEQEAIQKYKTFFELSLDTIKYKCFNERNRILIEKNKDIKTLSLFENYLFIKWIDKLPRRDTRKNVFLKMLSDHYKPITNPEYSYDNNYAYGLGYAYEKKIISISFNTSLKWNECFIKIKSLGFNKKYTIEEKENLKVKNISKKKNIDYHKRTFMHHTKHNKNNSAKNESPLLYNPSNNGDLKIIQNLLNCAIPVRKGSKIFCFYDENRSKYIKFHPESKKKGSINENNYHAFHIDNENDIPEVTKKQITEIINKITLKKSNKNL